MTMSPSHPTARTRVLGFFLLVTEMAWIPTGFAPAADPNRPALEFLHWGFENASPLQWQTDGQGVIHIGLLYDYERGSPNRAAGHWHFQLQGRPGAELTLVLENFENIYNGRLGIPVSKKSICYTSSDGSHWKVVPTEFLEGNRLRIQVRLEGGSLYLARLEPYRLSDLAHLLDEIRGRPLVEDQRHRQNGGGPAGGNGEGGRSGGAVSDSAPGSSSCLGAGRKLGRPGIDPGPAEG